LVKTVSRLNCDWHDIYQQEIGKFRLLNEDQQGRALLSIMPKLICPNKEPEYQATKGGDQFAALNLVESLVNDDAGNK